MPRKDEPTWAEKLLGDEDVRRWHENHGSKATADNYLRTLGRFLDSCGLSPAGYVALDPKTRADVLHDFIQGRLKEGRAPSYVQVTRKAVVSWLAHHGEALGRPVKVKGASRRPSLKDAHIPSQEELRRVLNVADVRGRTATALIAFSGLRPQTLGSYDGDDGLRLSNFPEARVDGVRLEFEQVPARIEVPEELSKAGRAYFTFLGPEGCEYLAAYLRERAEGGEALEHGTPIITPRKVAKPFMTSIKIGSVLRRPMRGAGLSEPPYIWRSYFSSRAMLAESSGLLKDWREFFMGHAGGIAEVYSLHKRLPPDAVEEMRSAYAEALPYMETRPQEAREDPTDRILGVILQAQGFTAEEVEELDVSSLSEEELVELVRRGSERKTATNGGIPLPRQRVVTMEEVPPLLEEGWLFKGNLPDGKVVVELA